MEELNRRLDEHIASDQAQFGFIRQSMESHADSLNRFETNHLAHMESDLNIMKNSLASLHAKFEGMSVKQAVTDTNTNWQDWALKLLIGAIVGGAISFFFYIATQRPG